MKRYTVIGALLLSSILFIGCGSSGDSENTGKEAPSKYLNYTTKTYLQFPFRGETIVAEGGRTLEENAHADMVDQRFALDIVASKDNVTPEEIKNESVKTYNGDPSKNENYYIFGREVVATATGTVVSTENNIADNVPGVENRQNIPGNHVVIDHGNGEFSMFAHFKQGSVRVHVGDKVKYGDVLGLCGNSGNSSEPHLHYHLQNTQEWLDGEGLPAQFNRYIANGAFVERGEPVSGEIITVE